MYCPSCRTLIPDDVTSCPSCGAAVWAYARSGATWSAVDASQAHGSWNASPRGGAGESLALYFVEGGAIVAQTTVALGRDQRISFGALPDNDLQVCPPSRTVSGHHGEIVVSGGHCLVRDLDSTNGLYLNAQPQREVRVAAGDLLTVGAPERGAVRCVLFVAAATEAWSVADLTPYQQLRVGRNADNDLVLDDVTVSAHHALLAREPGAWTISDLGSTNGTKVDGAYLRGTQELSVGSTIELGNSRLVFLEGCLMVVGERHGVNVVCHDLVRYRKVAGAERITCDHISLSIKRGEFVALVGGSGCGKSTLLNELNGTEPADEGWVELDGMDLYDNYGLIKSSIGYVPQADIVYDSLSLEAMLAYAARLRMQADTTAEERAARVDAVISLLELEGVRTTLIRRLSGGQRKRASIAVELLADPRLLFLDEPTSGLDPGIERKLMESLARMAHEGRTIILVTHTTLNLHLCDQVVFLGSGGKLCYAGDPAGALGFFGVTDYVDVYPLIDADPDTWARRFAERSGAAPEAPRTAAGQGPATGRSQTGFFSQLATLSARYAHLIVSEPARLALMVGQAPLLAALINLVASSKVFAVCEDTKYYLFALSCCAFWVGIFDSIQEICKEGAILAREHDGGIRTGAYLASKVLVLGVLGLVQTLLLLAVTVLGMGLPQNPLFAGFLELAITTYLTVMAAMCLGLLVSALFRSPAAALAVAPILIMPQILFSGIAFELKGVNEALSWACNCRWAIEAYGTTADLNGLDLAVYGQDINVPASEETIHDVTVEVPASTVVVETEMGPMEVEVPAEERTFDELEVEVPATTKTIDAEMLEHEQDKAYTHKLEHLFASWGIQLGFCVAFLVACRVALMVLLGK